MSGGFSIRKAAANDMQSATTVAERVGFEFTCIL